MGRILRERAVSIRDVYQRTDNMVELFDNGIEERKDHEAQVQALQSKIGQLTMENDFLAKALEP